MRILMFTLLVLLLTGCSGENVEQIDIGDDNYSLFISNVQYVKNIEDGNVAATNMPDVKEGRNDWRVEIFEAAPSCAPSAIGINSPITLGDSKNENIIWGRMDYGEIYYTGDFPQEFTKPCSYSGENVYAFCSEKDNKRVVICISQQTDDKKMAEEIFKSFRWTE